LFLLSGCSTYTGHLDIRSDIDKMIFSSPDRTAMEDCKNKVVDDEYFKRGVWMFSITTIMAQKKYEYQDCMARKGYPCKDGCAYDPARK
jgi:hypothetical protein